LTSDTESSVLSQKPNDSSRKFHRTKRFLRQNQALLQKNKMIAPEILTEPSVPDTKPNDSKPNSYQNSTKIYRTKRFSGKSE